MACYGARAGGTVVAAAVAPDGAAAAAGYPCQRCTRRRGRSPDCASGRGPADCPHGARGARSRVYRAPRYGDHWLSHRSPSGARGGAGLVLLARARRHPRDCDRGVGPASATARPGHASLFLAGCRLLRRPVIHAEWTLRSARLLFRVGRSGGTAGTAAPFPPLRARFSRTPAALGSWRRRAAAPAVALRARRRARRRPGAHRCRPPDGTGRVARARAHRVGRISLPGRLSARWSLHHGPGAHQASVGDRAPPASLDRLGIDGRRRAVRHVVRRAAAL